MPGLLRLFEGFVIPDIGIVADVHCLISEFLDAPEQGDISPSYMRVMIAAKGMGFHRGCPIGNDRVERAGAWLKAPEGMGGFP